MIATARHPMEKGWALMLAGFGTLLLGSCAAPQVATPPPPKPVVVHTPAPPPPPPPAPADWRDAPQTPGDWSWSIAGGRSTARYGRPGFAPFVQFSCDRAGARVILMVSGNATAAVPMAVRTTYTLRPMASDPALSPPGWLAVAIPARDPLLDAIAFSRGRFAIEAAGLETLYLPAWPELSRVIEDCR